MTRTYRYAPTWALRLIEENHPYYVIDSVGIRYGFDYDAFYRSRIKLMSGKRPRRNDGAFSSSTKHRMIQKRNERRWKRYQERNLIRKGLADDLPMPPEWDWLD